MDAAIGIARLIIDMVAASTSAAASHDKFPCS
eukprot:Gb_38132 [translate_table: standard]